MTHHAECVELIRNGLEVVTKLAHTIKDDLFPGEECDEANTWALYASRYLESHSDDTIHLSDEGAKALREVGQEQVSEPPQWHEGAHIPEGEVSTGIDDYSLPAQQEEGQNTKFVKCRKCDKRLPTPDLCEDCFYGAQLEYQREHGL